VKDEYIVVWSGSLERKGKARVKLVPDRATRVSDTWTPPRRLYNKTGKHSRKINQERE
jgi:hypothetical protein